MDRVTRLIYLLKGTPLSRAKDHNKRDAVAMIPIAAAVMRMRIKAVIAVEPALLLVACTNISMKGNPVGLIKALLILPRQNRRAIYCFD
jgi:hypothetical protein